MHQSKYKLCIAKLRKFVEKRRQFILKTILTKFHSFFSNFSISDIENLHSTYYGRYNAGWRENKEYYLVNTGYLILERTFPQ